MNFQILLTSLKPIVIKISLAQTCIAWVFVKGLFFLVRPQSGRTADHVLIWLQRPRGEVVPSSGSNYGLNESLTQAGSGWRTPWEGLLQPEFINHFTSLWPVPPTAPRGFRVRTTEDLETSAYAQKRGFTSAVMMFITESCSKSNPGLTVLLHILKWKD